VIIAGIDFSLTSPAICVHSGTEFSYDNCKFYYISSLKKTIASSNNMTGTLYPEYDTVMQRYQNISTWVMNIITTSKVSHVYLEDYAFGATGRVFHIAENTGILKYNLWQNDIPIVTIPPTVIKKFATGKGNANKEILQEHFITETGIDIKTQLQLTLKQWNPSSDIIDSYYICKYGVSEYGKEK